MRDVRSECQTAGATPKRRSKRSSHWEDRAISAAGPAPGGLAQAFGDGFQIDLGLAGAGDAVQQGDGEVAGSDGLAQRGGGGLLVGGQDRAGVVRVGAGEWRRHWQRRAAAVRHRPCRAPPGAGPATRARSAAVRGSRVCQASRIRWRASVMRASVGSGSARR